MRIAESTTNVILKEMAPFGLRAVVIFCLAVLLFAPVTVELIKTWSTDGDYSHGFLVLPISLCLIWMKRKKLSEMIVKPVWIAFPIVVLSLAGYIISYTTRVHTFTHISMILATLALLVFLTGWRIAREVFFPVIFLSFMFPIPSSYYVLLTNPLKLVITELSSEIIYAFGIPVLREGNLIFLPNMHLEVAEACSGIRSLYSYLMLGSLFAYFSNNWLVRMILLTSAILLAFLVNLVRVSLAGILAFCLGAAVSKGFFHEFQGTVLFVIGFCILFAEFHFLGLISRQQDSSHS